MSSSGRPVLRVTYGDQAAYGDADVRNVWSLQVLSDLHLEMEGQTNFLRHFTPCAPYLALCGDIGNPYEEAYVDLLADVSTKFERVFVVAGNHEFYRNEYTATRKYIRELCGVFGNVSFLDRDSIVVGKVRVIGCTLWSSEGSLRFNDYYIIKYGDRVPTPEDTTIWHHEDVNFIEEQLALAASENQAVVGLSHHLPHLTCASIGTDLRGMICSPSSPVRMWCYGHSHGTLKESFGKQLLVSNQLGYHWAMNQRDTRFRPHCVAAMDITRPNQWVLEGAPLP
ncbi:Serine/threonine protein phosphatase [Pelomyxa schiedti]|nr:Serine/threonine protein phosphatase [Pelomyxa schiedti]